MRIDSHQHFWNFNPPDYPWINDTVPVLKRDYLPDDLAPGLKKAGLDGCVAVQARQTLAESHWLLNLADHYPIIKGVVGWVDLCSPLVEQQLAEVAKHPRFRGVRHVLQDEPDDCYALGKTFQNGISKLQQFGLTYDLLIYPKQLPASIELVSKFPGQKFVLDHIAKPSIKDRALEPWATQLRQLAKAPNVWCKLSGMVTEAKRHAWQQEDFVPYLDIVFEAFSPSRLMFGSDWPVALLGADYQQVYSIIDQYTRNRPQPERDKIFGDNARDFYQLKP